MTIVAVVRAGQIVVDYIIIGRRIVRVQRLEENGHDRHRRIRGDEDATHMRPWITGRGSPCEVLDAQRTAREPALYGAAALRRPNLAL